MDTTRADRMGFLGSKRGVTPNLDILARQGVVFERAYSQAPLTPVSHATIFTGTYPQFHTVTHFGHPLPAFLPFVPEILHNGGYHTAAFIGSLILDPKAIWRQGFPLITMMSDHGESLGAHGESMHGIFLYDETIRVPLLLKLPGELLAGRRVPGRVRLVDVAPTLLSMLSVPLPPTFQGESRVPMMKAPPQKSSQKPAADLPAYAETDYPHRAFGWELDPFPAHRQIPLRA